MKQNVLASLFSFAVAWLILACLAVSISVTAQVSRQGDLKRTFSIEPEGRLVMDVGPGSIEVRTNGDSRIEVEVFRKVEKGSESRAEEILRQHEVLFEQHENNLTIREKFRHDGFKLWQRYGLSIRYVVSIPTEFNVDLKTSGGSISVDNLRGEVRARTSGGGLSFGKIEGPVIGHTSGGSISLAGCNGKTEIKTSGGGIHIASGSGDMSAATSGGSIKIENFNGNLIARSDGGGIKADSVTGSLMPQPRVDLSSWH